MRQSKGQAGPQAWPRSVLTTRYRGFEHNSGAYHSIANGVANCRWVSMSSRCQRESGAEGTCSVRSRKKQIFCPASNRSMRSSGIGFGRPGNRIQHL